MISPPTDRLHKFLAIAGTALFIVGVTIPLDRYDQSVRQFIEAKSKFMELSQAQLRLSKWLEAQTRSLAEHTRAAKAAQGDPQQQQQQAAANAFDPARLEAEAATFEREIADLSIQAGKQGDLAEHAQRVQAVWLVLGCACILGGLALAVAGFAMWWRQPENER